MIKFKEEGIEGLRKKLTRPTPNRIPEDVEKMMVEVRKKGNWGLQESSNYQ